LSTVALAKDPISFPAIEIGEVTGLEPANWTLRIQGPRDDLEITFDAAALKGVLVTIQQYGDFEISYKRQGQEATKLCHEDKDVIAISAESWYLESIGKCPPPFPLGLVLGCSIGGGILLITGVAFVVYMYLRPKPKPLSLEPGVLSTPVNAIHDPFMNRT
jgi:hypothetical protein